MRNKAKKIKLEDMNLDDIREQNVSIFTKNELNVRCSTSCTAAGGGNCGSAGAGGGA